VLREVAESARTSA